MNRSKRGRAGNVAGVRRVVNAAHMGRWRGLGALRGGVGGGHEADSKESNNRLLITFAPFMVMTGLLILGGIVGHTSIGVLDFLLMPKGALMTAAILALLQTPSDARRDCLDSAVRRTRSLLLVIGAASAFGAVLTGLVALEYEQSEGRIIRILAGGAVVQAFVGLALLLIAVTLWS